MLQNYGMLVLVQMHHALGLRSAHSAPPKVKLMPPEMASQSADNVSMYGLPGWIWQAGWVHCPQPHLYVGSGQHGLLSGIESGDCVRCIRIARIGLPHPAPFANRQNSYRHGHSWRSRGRKLVGKYR